MSPYLASFVANPKSYSMKFTVVIPVNVNKVKDMDEMKRREKMMERQALKGLGRPGLDDKTEVGWSTT